jgi:endoglucanase
MRKANTLLILLILLNSILLAQPSPFIHVDQFGYHLTAEKVAVLSDPQTGYNAALSYNPPATIELRNATTNSVVFSAAIAQWNSGITHDRSGDRGWWFEFSTVTTPGSYYVHDPVNNQSSSVFEISDYPYGDVLKAAGRAFYYNRCNAPKLEEHAGSNWTDATNFLNALQDANCRYIHDKNNAALEKDLSGGWFDAGDYNKYVTFTYSTLHDLLYAFEESPSVFGDDWNIPESGNGIPDLIDEVKWELDWMIKMANPDGSVHIKMGSQNYSENIGAPPSVNTDPRFYGPTCTSASATVASVFAHASIVFGNFPEFSAYSADLLAIAESTFAYVLPHFNNNTFETECDNGEIISGDADRSVQEQIDMLISASVYLFEKTGNSSYNSFFINNYMQAKPMNENFWGPYTIPVQDAMLRYTTLSGANISVSSDIINRATTLANNNWNEFYGWNPNDLYRAFMPDWSYHWGSNHAKAGYGNLNNRLSDMGISNVASQRKMAKELVHYFHGVNPQGMVYLSNMYDFGAERSANEIYHTWFHDGTDWDNALTSPYGPAPGFLSGGPNKDFTVTSIIPPAGQPPQKSYKDWNATWPENSWEITEPSIYNQAAYLRLLARVMHLSRQTAWNGSAGSDWGNPANWSAGYVPGANSDITIAAAANQPVLDGNRILDNLVIQPSATLTIPPNASLTVGGVMDNQAGINGVVVQSDATGTGSLIVNNQGVESIIERHIEHADWSDPHDGWHMLAAPVIGQNFQPDFVADPPGAYQDFYKWHEPSCLWINSKTSGGLWNTAFEETFVPGRGYLISYAATPPKSPDGSITKMFGGELHHEDVEIEVTNSGSGGAFGFNLLGNPFSSALLWNDQNWDLGNVGGVAYVWDRNMKDYKALSLPGEPIPAMNGFMVYADQTQHLVIPSAARSHHPQGWYKSPAERIVLMAENLTDLSAKEVIIRFHPDATEGFDLAFDGYYLQGFGPVFYSMAGSDRLSVNTLPEFSDDLTIPLVFGNNGNGELFRITLCETLQNVGLCLIDLKAEKNVNLSDLAIYQFKVEQGDSPNRFLLKFGAVGIEEMTHQSGINAWVYDNMLFVNNLQGNSTLIELFDLTGRKLRSEILSGEGLKSMNISLSAGVYLVRLTSGGNTKTIKAAIN